MARRYHVEGTKSYLIAALVLGLLSIWHIVDGWVPQVRWMGAPASGSAQIGGVEIQIRAEEHDKESNDHLFRFEPLTPMLPRTVREPVVVEEQTNGLYVVSVQAGVATWTNVVMAIDTLPDYRASIPAGVAADGVVPAEAEINQVAVLTGGVFGKYPNFPTKWYDMGLHEFYAYNRWTGVLMGIAALVCAYIHRVVR